LTGIWEILFGIVLLLFLVQFVRAFVLCNRHKNNERPEFPRIKSLSVIIPHHNEENRIHDLLESRNDQKIWSDNIELIFVNDFSDDKINTSDFTRYRDLVSDKVYEFGKYRIENFIIESSRIHEKPAGD